MLNTTICPKAVSANLQHEYTLQFMTGSTTQEQQTEALAQETTGDKFTEVLNDGSNPRARMHDVSSPGQRRGTYGRRQ